ncbi:hypothetical protein HD597_012410 [Nonomuraea thailandensis]|uniref:Uncharacterized protein n=1 Tax=Nonomuraea thailandensis TaxID=1188745 RepID=A0A9X2GWU2_9ACTN|nr:hypothetical protein [Nonomuraea thailandensis]MCP2365390.1 hypothetical protein [Nonomuraea thailandensis]
MTGLLVGAVFGAVFVLVNAHEPLNSAVATVLRIIAVLAAGFVLVLWFATARAERTAPVPASAASGQGSSRPKSMFTPGYLAVVAAEAVLLFGGIPVLAALGAPAQANVAWVAFVVGVHFLALAPIWKDRVIAVPGAVLALLGVAGFAMAWTSAADWTPFVSGVLSGLVLLAGSVTGGRLITSSTRGRQEPA